MFWWGNKEVTGEALMKVNVSTRISAECKMHRLYAELEITSNTPNVLLLMRKSAVNGTFLGDLLSFCLYFALSLSQQHLLHRFFPFQTLSLSCCPQYFAQIYLSLTFCHPSSSPLSCFPFFSLHLDCTIHLCLPPFPLHYVLSLSLLPFPFFS